MMMHTGLESRVRADLENAVGRLKEHGGIWRFSPPSLASLEVCAWLDRPWLQFDSTPAAARKPARWMVEKNTRIRGAAKFALMPGDQRLHIRAELPLADEIDLPAGIVEVCASLADANSLLGRTRPQKHPVTAESSEGLAQNVADICRESGWDFQERSSTELSIDLEIPADFSQALLEPTDSGHVRLSAEVVDQESTSDVCCEALAVILARACGAFRMMRAVLKADPERLSARLELVWVSLPTPYAVSEALAALSVAIRLCGAEARALARDEVVARAYLARPETGLVPHRGRTENHRSGTQVPTTMGQVALNARATWSINQ